MTTQQTAVNVQFSTSVQPGPDGSPWVGLTIETPVSAYVVGLPPDVARAVASGVPDMLTEAADLADRQGSGIIAVPADALNRLNRPDRKN